MIASQNEMESKLFDNGKNKARELMITDGPHLIVDLTPAEKKAVEEAKEIALAEAKVAAEVAVL